MKQGYSIIDRNWNLHKGCELDLVAYKDGELHFIEVKTRSNARYSRPEEAINLTKLKHIGTAISYYIACKPFYRDTPFHVDAIGVVYRSEQDYEINFMPDINYYPFSRRRW